MIATMRIAMTEIVQPAALTAATTIGAWALRWGPPRRSGLHHRSVRPASDIEAGGPG
jgi:hypothetical protein